jgi:dolichol kinase
VRARACARPGTNLKTNCTKQFGLLPILDVVLVTKVLAISIACGVVELLPSERFLPGKLGDDNITVPLAAAVLTALLF